METLQVIQDRRSIRSYKKQDIEKDLNITYLELDDLLKKVDVIC